MPRAKRYFLPGYLYHITHRCHDRVFLLKHVNYKARWLYWMSRGIDAHGLHVLGYCITDNHVHIIAHPQNSHTVIARTMHLIAGRVGQEYNQNNNRKGAFWEDRYHATAIQSKDHLIRCLLYIDFNMVRASVVTHPSKWPYCGFTEMIRPSSAEHIINRSTLLSSTGFSDWKDFLDHYKKTIDRAQGGNAPGYDDRWTKSLAVGNMDFVEQIKKKLGYRGRYRRIESELENNEQGRIWHLREPGIAYKSRMSDSKPYYEDNLISWENDVDESAGLDIN